MVTYRFPFPIAAHSYFHVTNKDEQRRRFISGEIEEPVFNYIHRFNAEVVERRLAQLPATEKAQLEFVQASLRLQTDASSLDEFRRSNQELFGIPRREYAEAVLERIAQSVAPNMRHIWDEITQRIGQEDFSHGISRPADEVFERYRGYFARYAPERQKSSTTVGHLIAAYLRTTDLDSKGWSVKMVPGIRHAQTNHRARTIIIGDDYRPRTPFAQERIAVHEVYGHALRGPQASVREAEGFAILLEQLTGAQFKYRRSYRYLAIALGWGVFGKPQTFRQVYEVLWRVMTIGSRYSVAVAKQHAFDECFRAFRGGRPDLAGAVFLKDGSYFEANIEMWSVLSKRPVSYNEFVDCIEGRRTLL